MFTKQRSRQQNFKKGVDADDSRRKREEATDGIRKNKRVDQLMKRRTLVDEPVVTVAVGGATAHAHAVPVTEPLNPAKLDPSVREKLPLLPQWTAMVMSDDANAQYEGTCNYRKLLSIERNPPIQYVLDQGVVPRLIQFLSAHDRKDLQFEAAWAITNVASGTPEQTRVVIENGAVPVLVQLLSSPSEDVREQAVWAIGNISGDSPLCRDFVLSHGALGPMLHILQTSKRTTMLRNATWTVSNFCRGKPQPQIEVVRACLPVLSSLVYFPDEEVLTDACWALSYISDGTPERIQAVIDSGVCRRLVELLMHPNAAVQTPALRTVGNIVTGDDFQTQVIVVSGALPCLLALLSNSKKGLRKEACWTISNITAGNKSQIQAVLQNGLIQPLVHILNTAEFDIKKEAAWAIANAASGGTPDQIRFLAQCKCVKPICDLLGVNDPKIVQLAIDCLDHILHVGEEEAEKTGTNPYALEVEEFGGLDKLDTLQKSQNREIYKRVVDVLETYFQGDSDEEDAAAAPQANAAANQFQFGVSAGQPMSFHFDSEMMQQ